MPMTDHKPFGPEYPKINTVFKRDERNLIMPGDYANDTLAYLAPCLWEWTEKVDGTNIRLHWDGNIVTIGGRTDNAQVPAKLITNLNAAGVFDAAKWAAMFPDANDVTVYGEGYGAGIQKGGIYRPDQSLVIFDVLVGSWWLRNDDRDDIASKLGLEVVPMYSLLSLDVAVTEVEEGARTPATIFQSAWNGATPEGIVGKPVVELFDRVGVRVMAKLKYKDFNDLQRKKGQS